MEKEFLKIGGFYEIIYPNKGNCYIKVLDIFPNNFIEAWHKEGYIDY